MLKSSVEGLSSRSLATLTLSEIEQFFHQSKKWDLAPTLLKGGSAIFPHTLIRTCGDQVAAVVRGCLDTGAPRVIVLGVLHSLDRAHIIAARKKVLAGDDISGESCWGIFGPLFPGERVWENEYSLLNFKFLWDFEVERRNLNNPPELILAYPCLANRDPSKLPNMEQLKSYLPGSVVVLTTDFCHHGKAYGGSDDQNLPISEEAEKYATRTILEGLKIFEKPDYARYIDYSFKTSSDGTDGGQILMHIKGPLKSQILDLRLVDVAHLFENEPTPSWVASALIEMTVIE